MMQGLFGLREVCSRLSSPKTRVAVVPFTATFYDSLYNWGKEEQAFDTNADDTTSSHGASGCLGVS